MRMKWILVFIFLTQVLAEDVLFESGKRFEVVNPDGTAEYEDPKNTGSKLFDASVDNNDKKRLSLLVLVTRIKSPTKNYFRAHPVFVSCLQAIMNDLQNEEKPVMIVSGYKSKSDTSGSTKLQDLYARAGTGAELAFRPGITEPLTRIVTVALKRCPGIFDRINRNFGLILMKDRVHLHLAGQDEEVPHFSAESGASMDTNAFKLFVQKAIDAGLDPAKSPDCSKVTSVPNGQSYPANLSPEKAVGAVDIPITRNTAEDFFELLQYQGSNVVFPNTEGNQAWCGFEGNPCPQCEHGIVGNSVSKRCANRLMTVKMGNALRLLQKLARDKIGSKLKVMKAFMEPYEGIVDYSSTSLHVEGRQLLVELNNANTPANLEKLTKFAKCIGVDYVKHNGDHVLLAVKKMKGETLKGQVFPETILIVVDPPAVKKQDYRLPKEFHESEEADYPLFDSSGQEDVELANGVRLGQFTSKDKQFRYFRLNPLIPRCLSQLQYDHNKANADADPLTELDVGRGFMSTRDQDMLISPFDKRYNSFILGIAMEVNYRTGHNHRNLTTVHLAQAIIATCGPMFSEEKQAMGIGLYKDKVFVDIRDEFEVWTDDLDLPEEFSTVQELKNEVDMRYAAAIDNRIIDPDDWEEAKLSANVPHKQSVSFVYKLPTRAPEASSGECVPQTNTPFCQKTKKHREEWIEKVWTEVIRKWHYHDGKEVRTALEKCLGLCGTCLDGRVFLEKVKHCENFLHWIPFALLNEDTVTNFFPRDDPELRRYACSGHCIEHSELFLLIVNAVEAVWRPDPQQSVEQDLYPQSENPSPVLAVLNRMYAMHATGNVKFFVQTNTDMSSLAEPLQIVAMYNKKVTSVEVNVCSPGNLDAVDGTIQAMKVTWATTGYPPVTREFLAPISVIEKPKLVAKRDVDRSIGEELINAHANREMRWANMEL